MLTQEHVTSTRRGEYKSLPYCILLEVLWQMCHVWITCWIASVSVLVTDRLSYTIGDEQKFATLHTSGSLMADVHCLEYP